MTALGYAALSAVIVPCVVAFALAATELVEAWRGRGK